GELLERPCAHPYETGGLRRAHVRGHEHVLKRLLVHAGAFNLGLWMRTLFGIGTPRGLQGRLVLPFINTVTHRGRRGARLARREAREYREYLSGEQRSQAGCIAGRMPPYL